MVERVIDSCMPLALVAFFSIFVWALDDILPLHFVQPESRPMGYIVIGGLLTAIDLLLVARKLQMLELTEGRARYF